MRRMIALAASLCILAPSFALGEIADSAANGFTVKIAANIQAAPADVYRRVIRNIGDWWDPEHTFSHDARNLSIDERPMGCFCEKLPNQGGVRHMEVVFLSPGKMLRLSGGLGPMQAIAATGSMTFTFSLAGAGTKLDLTYTVVGYQPQGMNSWAAPLDRVLGEQLARLKNYIERGSPTAKGEEQSR